MARELLTTGRSAGLLSGRMNQPGTYKLLLCRNACWNRSKMTSVSHRHSFNQSVSQSVSQPVNDRPQRESWTASRRTWSQRFRHRQSHDSGHRRTHECSSAPSVALPVGQEFLNLENVIAFSLSLAKLQPNFNSACNGPKQPHQSSRWFPWRHRRGNQRHQHDN